MNLRRPGFFAVTDRPSPFPGASAVKIGARPDLFQILADRLGDCRADPVGNIFSLDDHKNALDGDTDITGDAGLSHSLAEHLDPDFVGRHVGYFA